MAIDSSDTPFVVFGDASNYARGMVTVMKYSQAEWVVVGEARFTPPLDDQMALNRFIGFAIDKSSGTPYVAFRDTSAWPDRATVMNLTGSGWANVGAAHFSPGRMNHIKLALDTSGTPYVAYSDEIAGRTVVMKYDGEAWVNVGLASGLDYSRGEKSFVISSSGDLYLAFTTGLKVMKYSAS